MPKHLQKKNKQKRKEKHMIKIFDGIITEEKTWEKKNIPPKSVVSGYRRKSVEDCKPIKFKPRSLRTPYQFEPHADSKSLSSIENLQLI